MPRIAVVAVAMYAHFFMDDDSLLANVYVAQTRDPRAAVPKAPFRLFFKIPAMAAHLRQLRSALWHVGQYFVCELYLSRNDDRAV